MKNFWFLFLFAAISSLLFSGCTWGNCFQSKAPLSSENRDLGEFTEIYVDGSLDVSVEQSQTHEIIVQAPADAQNLILTELKRSRLHISYAQCISTDHDIEIQLKLPVIEKLSLDGSGDIFTISQITADELVLEIEGSGDIEVDVQAQTIDVDINGSGDVELSGEAEMIKASLQGSGDISAFDLDAKHCEASINGSGDIWVFVTKELEVDIQGSGDLHYRGNPKKVQSNINGSGTVVKSR